MELFEHNFDYYFTIIILQYLSFYLVDYLSLL